MPPAKLPLASAPFASAFRGTPSSPLSAAPPGIPPPRCAALTVLPQWPSLPSRRSLPRPAGAGGVARLVAASPGRPPLPPGLRQPGIPGLRALPGGPAPPLGGRNPPPIRGQQFRVFRDTNLLPLPLLAPGPPPFGTRGWSSAGFATRAEVVGVPGGAEGLAGLSRPLGAPKGVFATEQLESYIVQHTREPQVLKLLRDETSSMSGSQMQITVEQGAFLRLIVALIGARKCIELGVFTGYSTICTALGLSDEGKVIACDRDPKALAVAQRYFAKAGVAHKIDVRLGDAKNTLLTLVEDPKELCSFDFAFLDADKRAYGDYYELLLKLVRPGGLIVVDNALWKGKVASEEVSDPATLSIRSLNQMLFDDKRIDFSLVSIGDGMALCRKIG